MYIGEKFSKFSVHELFKFCHISKTNTCIVLCMWQLKHCFHLLHLYIHTHTCAQTHTYTYTHTHTHTHTHTLTLSQIKILQFFG